MDLNSLPYPHRDELTASFRQRASLETRRTIHLVALNVWPNDAVSNHTIELALFLGSLGIDVRLYGLGDGIHPQFRQVIRPRSELSAAIQEDDLLIYQYSIGDDFLDEIIELKVHRKAAYFHGITPPELTGIFGPHVTQACQKGLDNLWKLQFFDHCWANSRFNLDQLLAAARDPRQILGTAVLPPFLSTIQWKAPSAPKELSRTRFLYVGRLYPHKNVEQVIETFAALHPLLPNSDLRIIGAGRIDAYFEKLKAQCTQHWGPDSEKVVSFIQNMTDDDLNRAYQESHVLLQFSNHEGFGMPLVEAMKTGVLVVTHDKAALSETMQGAGYIASPESLRQNPGAFTSLLKDPAKLKPLLQKQNTVFDAHYSEAAVQGKYLHALHALIDGRRQGKSG